MGCYGSSALAAAAVDGVVGAGPAVAVWWLLGYSRRGISPTLGDSACAAVRGCVLGCSQWGISLPLAAPGLGNRQHDLGNALRAARRAATASATSPLLWSCGMPAVCVFGGGVHVPFVRSVLAANAPRATHPPGHHFGCPISRNSFYVFVIAPSVAASSTLLSSIERRLALPQPATPPVAFAPPSPAPTKHPLPPKQVQYLVACTRSPLQSHHRIHTAFPTTPHTQAPSSCARHHPRKRRW